MATKATRNRDLLTKSSYCRNSKHARCKTEGCSCQCHGAVETMPEISVEDANAEVAASTADAQEAPAKTVDQQIAEAVEGVQGTEIEKARARAAAYEEIAPAKKPRAKKKAAAPAPDVAAEPGDGKLTGDQKRALREQMVTYLGAMKFKLGPRVHGGVLDGVSPEQAAAYVDQYWVKFIDPERFNGRAIAGPRPGANA